MAMLSTQQAKNLKPTKHWQRKLDRQSSATSATAQTFTFDIPRDHFIHSILITVYEHTAATYDPTKLADALSSSYDITLIGNGNKYIKQMTPAMLKNLMRMEILKPQTGLYEILFTSPTIPDAQPLPSWLFTSLKLQFTDSAPASTKYHYIDVVLIESAYESQDLSNWHILIEKYLQWKKFGANTGEQNYEHERAYLVYGYLFEMDDNGTDSNTIYDLLKVLGRKPEGELSIVYMPVTALRAENAAEIGIDTLDTGFCYLAWKDGFPANEFSSLYTKPNIPSAGTNAGLRVLERYTL